MIRTEVTQFKKAVGNLMEHSNSMLKILLQWKRPTEMNTLIAVLTCCAICLAARQCPTQGTQENVRNAKESCVSAYKLLPTKDKDGDWQFQKSTFNFKGGVWDCYGLPRKITIPGNCNIWLGGRTVFGIGFRDGNAVAIYL
ncbi:hypothetical protein Y032_0207g2042 [Ancylostoma ceylanicum]|uniref:Uncharacterized protein n=1 Tax=Ancylostoma ceylanicum TaxID=53326 RepID=A0A016SKV9_9BILA|nr:hypothetical protein Y032_0207g2042 [Ancylostoma ceylanicum]